LGEVLSIEEFVHPFLGGGAVSIRIFGEDPAALAVGAGFETRTLDRSAEEGQERTQDEDHHEQACFGQSQVLGGGE